MTGSALPSQAVDVLVVGGGHHGLATAIGCGRAGLTVELVDTGVRPLVPWTDVHHWSVLADLHRLGLLDDVLAVGLRRTTWGLRVLRTGEQITYDLGDLAGLVDHAFNLHVPDEVLRGVLLRHLRSLTGATAVTGRVRGLREHAGTVTVELDTPEGFRVIRATWVVAADGPASDVRREAGIAFEGSTWRERGVVALVRHDFAGMGYADTTFQVDDEWGAVVERVDDDVWRYVYQEPGSRDGATVRARIPDVLRHAPGVGAGREIEVLASDCERMHQRVATRFRSGRTLLVGEAAHVTHRLVGHSSTSGWFDAFSLARVLPEVVSGRVDDRALTAWADQRRRVYLDEALPASLSRKVLVSEMRDKRSLDVELDQFRQALIDPVVRREVLLQGRELDGALMEDPAP